MSQAGVKIIPKRAKPVHSEVKGKRKASGTPAPSRGTFRAYWLACCYTDLINLPENSGCSVRIHQVKRLKNNQVEKVDLAFSVTDSQDGTRRELSYQSRRSSVQCKPSASISQVIEGEQSLDTLVEDIPRCASPTDMECDGFCPDDDGPPDSATVVRGSHLRPCPGFKC